MPLASRAYFLIISILPLLLTPAHSRGQQFAPGAAEPRLAKAVPLVDGNYRLSPNEVVKVTVYQEDDLTTTARIAEDGTIQLPLIRSVQIGGKTVREADAAIEAALRQDYLVQPHVSVTVVEFAKRRFSILGQVKSPGSYEIPANESVDLIQAVGLAGGYTRQANPSKIVVKRGDQIYRLNGKELARSTGEKAFRVMPGDTITVEESIF